MRARARPECVLSTCISGPRSLRCRSSVVVRFRRCFPDRFSRLGFVTITIPADVSVLRHTHTGSCRRCRLHRRVSSSPTGIADRPATAACAHYTVRVPPAVPPNWNLSISSPYAEPRLKWVKRVRSTIGYGIRTRGGPRDVSYV